MPVRLSQKAKSAASALALSACVCLAGLPHRLMPPLLIYDMKGAIAYGGVR
jgi:hypothetical protein